MHIFQQGSQEAPSDRLPTARPGDVRGTACARSDGTLGRTDFRIIPTLVFTFVNAENFDSNASIMFHTNACILHKDHCSLLRRGELWLLHKTHPSSLRTPRAQRRRVVRVARGGATGGGHSLDLVFGFLLLLVWRSVTSSTECR